MFCPKCGRLLPDNAIICDECGHRIRKCDRRDLGEEQPSEGDRDRPVSHNGIMRDATLVAQFVFCIGLSLTVLQTWIEPGGISGTGMLSEELSFRGSDRIMEMLPVVVAAFGILGAILSTSIRAHRMLIFPIMITTVGALLLFGINVEKSGYALGYGVYAAIIFSTMILILQIKDRMRS